MKNIFLVRHAKSSWESIDLQDIDRPLLPKGIKRTQLVIDYLQQKKINADLIISSPAVRAQETAILIAQGIAYDPEKIVINRDIYFGDTDSFFEALYQTDDCYNNVFIFGHNPTITIFSNYFLKSKLDNLPTTGVVNIAFKTNKWTDIPNCKWEEGFVITPRMLKK